jgi:hypothetical protein
MAGAWLCAAACQGEPAKPQQQPADVAPAAKDEGERGPTGRRAVTYWGRVREAEEAAREAEEAAREAATREMKAIERKHAELEREAAELERAAARPTASGSAVAGPPGSETAPMSISDPEPMSRAEPSASTGGP